MTIDHCSVLDKLLTLHAIKITLPWQPQILADQLTLSQPGGADYAHHITTATPGSSERAVRRQL